MERTKTLTFSIFILLLLQTGGLAYSQLVKTYTIGKGDNLRWSPDGSKLAYTSAGSIYVYDFQNSRSKKIADVPTNRLLWLDDTSLVVLESTSKALRLKKLYLNGELELLDESGLDPEKGVLTSPFVLSDGSIGYYKSYEGKTVGRGRTFIELKKSTAKRVETISTKPIVVKSLDPKGIASFGAIYLESADGSYSKQITPNTSFYVFPKLSPDASRILAIDGASRIVILDTTGNIIHTIGPANEFADKGRMQSIRNKFKTNLEIIAGFSFTNWGPDGKQITFSLDYTDGHQTYGTDIYIANPEDTTVEILTNNPFDVFDAPTFSPDGRMVVCNSPLSRVIKIFEIQQKREE